MRFLIITHAAHTLHNGQLYAYGPYVREMDLWTAHAKSTEIMAPLATEKPSAIALPYKKKDISFSKIPAISLLTFSEKLKAIINAPLIFLKIVGAMRRAEHIHLRCPGNIGLLGCMAQIFFPKKHKTAKYAGNWDPNATQPWSYRLQKWILSNTFLTKNMKVLVYGHWPELSKNIVHFFTASYSKRKIKMVEPKAFNGQLHFIFVGTLAKGKRPLYGLQLVENLWRKGLDCRLDFYGEGPERLTLLGYIEKNNLQAFVKLHGNQPSEVIEFVYSKSHFLLLPSHSEGWPKAVAEAMFWGVIPLVTPISCVPWMLDDEKRGSLLTLDMENDSQTILRLLKFKDLQQMSKNASHWSQQYTLELFAEEINKLL